MRSPALLVIVAVSALAAEPATLVPTGRIPLPEVGGRIDHCVLDAQRHRLFVAALGNGTVEVVDLDAKVVVHRLTKLAEPQGVAYLAAADRLFVTCGEGGRIDVYGGADLDRVGSIETRDDPDNLRVDADEHLLYVGHGTGKEGAIGVVDPANLRRIADIPVGGHPEAFALEPGGSRVFVNVPDQQAIVVVDRTTRANVATWGVPAAANYPMALDTKRRRILVGCRKPAAIVAVSMTEGSVVDRLDGPGDADDLWYDAALDRVYATGGDGTVAVLAYSADDRLTLTERVATSAGARTSLFDPDSRHLFVAAPRRKDQAAAILVFTVGP